MGLTGKAEMSISTPHGATNGPSDGRGKPLSVNPLGPIADLAVIIDSTYCRRHK